MKKYMLPLMLTLFTTALFAQPEVPNQNPNFKISRARYMGARDSLLSTQGSTVQNTYKAYDWMQLRQERKDIRFQNRQQRRLNRSLNGRWSLDYPGGYYNQPYYNNGFYNNGYINNGSYNRNFYNNRYRSNGSSFWWWFGF